MPLLSLRSGAESALITSGGTHFSPKGTFIKGIAEYDYFWKDDTTAGLENVDNFDFQELTDEDEKTLKYCFVEWNCYCRYSAKEWGWRALRFWQRILG